LGIIYGHPWMEVGIRFLEHPISNNHTKFC
jgi:hypothetical protein